MHLRSAYLTDMGGSECSVSHVVVVGFPVEVTIAVGHLETAFVVVIVNGIVVLAPVKVGVGVLDEVAIGIGVGEVLIVVLSHGVAVVGLEPGVVIPVGIFVADFATLRVGVRVLSVIVFILILGIVSRFIVGFIIVVELGIIDTGDIAILVFAGGSVVVVEVVIAIGSEMITVVGIVPVESAEVLLGLELSEVSGAITLAGRLVATLLGAGLSKLLRRRDKGTAFTTFTGRLFSILLTAGRLFAVVLTAGRRLVVALHCADAGEVLRWGWRAISGLSVATLSELSAVDKAENGECEGSEEDQLHV